MRSNGIWHPRIAALTCSLMHGDLLILADAAFPVPRDIEVIDLGWARRQPRLLAVLATVCSELYVEAAYVAENSRTPSTVQGSPRRWRPSNRRSCRTTSSAGWRTRRARRSAPARTRPSRT
jgi:RbsD / FucU transport protein family